VAMANSRPLRDAVPAITKFQFMKPRRRARAGRPLRSGAWQSGC
jgi:hypothetical protein